MRIWLSRDCIASHFCDGCTPTAGILCIYGSAMYFITTGMSKSHARTDLSSDVVTNRRFSSMNVMVLTIQKSNVVLAQLADHRRERRARTLQVRDADHTPG